MSARRGKTKPGEPNFILQRKWEDALLYLSDNVMTNMSGFHRKNYGETIMERATKILDMIISISRMKAGPEGGRLPHLIEIDQLLNGTLRFIAVANKAGAVKDSEYFTCSDKFAEVGKILGGLIKKAS